MSSSKSFVRDIYYSFEEKLLMDGLKVPSPGIEIKIKNASSVLDKAMEYFLSLKGDTYMRLPEYDRIAAWLENNHQKGLFMYGSHGRGKTMLGRYVIPAIVWKYCNGRKFHCYDIHEWNSKPREILEQRLISLDDIGAELVSASYGKKRRVFEEIINAVDKEGKLILITSNLNKDGILKCYGERVFEQLIANTIRVPFEGESLRNRLN